MYEESGERRERPKKLLILILLVPVKKVAAGCLGWLALQQGQ